MSNLAQEEADRFFNYKPSIASHPEDSKRDNSDSESGDTQPRRGIKSNRQFHTEDQDTDDEDTSRNLSTLSGNKQSYTVPTTAQYANTGPKGVIADAQNYHRAKQTRPQTTQHTTTQPSISQSQPTKSTDHSSDDEDIDLLDDPDTDPFMQSWRSKRLAELQEQYTTSPSSDQTPHPNRTYGTLEPVNATGYLTALESTPPSTPVVVLIYDPLNADSLEVEDELKMLAYRWNKTRFIKLHQKIAEMRSVQIPAVLVYRGGEVIVTMSGVGPEEGVEGTLMKQGILMK